MPSAPSDRNPPDPLLDFVRALARADAAKPLVNDAMVEAARSAGGVIVRDGIIEASPISSRIGKAALPAELRSADLVIVADMAVRMSRGA